MIKSYAISVDFMGLRLENLETGKLMLVSEKRLYDVLMVNRHNHLRLSRIMACLSIVGFRRYATALIQFLHDRCHKDIRLADIRKICDDKWLQYDRDSEILKICGIPSEEYLNTPHPILQSKEELEKLKD